MKRNVWRQLVAVGVAVLVGAASSAQVQARISPLMGPSGEKIYGSGTVDDALFLSNGDILTAGGLGLQVWSGSTGEFKRWVGALEEFTSTVTALALSADEEWVLAGGRDCMAMLFDFKTGRKLTSFRHIDQVTATTLTDEISAVALSPDGTRVLTGNLSNGLRYWNAETGELLGELSNLSLVHCCQFLDNTKIVCHSGDPRAPRVTTWDFERKAELPWPSEIVTGALTILVSPDRQNVLVAKADELIVWNTATQTVEERYQNNWNKTGTVAAFAPDGQEFALMGRNDKEEPYHISLYRNGKVETQDLSDSPQRIHYSKDGSKILFVQHGLEIWDAATLSPQKRMGDFDFMPHAGLSPDEKKVVTGFYEPRIVDLETGSVTEPTMPTNGRYFNQFFYAPDGGSVVGYGVDPPYSSFLGKWDVETMEAKWLNAGIFGSYSDITLSPDGSKLLVFEKMRAAFIDIESGELMVESPFDLGEIGYVAYSPDEQEIYVYSMDIFEEKAIFVYDSNLYEEKRILFLENDYPREFLVPSDGKSFVTLDSDWTFSEAESATYFTHFIEIGNLDNGETINEFPILEDDLSQHKLSNDWPHCWQLTRNEEELLVGYHSGKIRGFSMKTGQLLRTLEGHRDTVFNLVLFKDGKRMMSNSNDGTIRIWNLDATEISNWECY